MHRRNLVLAIAGVLSFGLTARADVVVTLRANDLSGGAVVGDIAIGSQIVVEVFISATGDDNPTIDVRDFALDFSATSESLERIQFEWLLDPITYGVRLETFPSPSAATTFFQSGPGLITFSDLPVLVGRATMGVNGSGTIDVITGLSGGANAGASFNAEFDNPIEFSVANGNVTGGSLVITATDSGGTGTDPDPDPTPTDSDGDGVPDSQDAFPNDASETADADGDGVGDNGDAFPDDPAESADTDGDGVGDNADAFSDDPDEQRDTDGDGIGDNEDTDDDGDDVDDTLDDFPLDPAETVDTDADGVGDNGDAFPTDANESMDSDNDGQGNNADLDDDNDGVPDDMDAFPTDPNETTDSDGDGVGDNADAGGGDANTGPRVGGGLCGMGMIGSFAAVFLSIGVLRGVRVTRRRAQRACHCVSTGQSA